MTVWRNRGFTENELSTPAKVIVGLCVAAAVLGAAVTATTHAIHGVAPRPWWAVLIFIGFLLFLLPKLHVVRHVRRISFGTALMTEGQANSYRVGYFLMGSGYLLTFL
jgi:Na+/phosphate symporter